jgi:hypothetical protein
MKVVKRSAIGPAGVCCTVIKGVVFRPGKNELSDDEFERVVGTPAFMSEINCGNMVLEGSYESETSGVVDAANNEEKAVKKAQDISSMSVRDAEKVISECTDTTLLREVIKSCSKKGINELAEKRIKAIKNQDGADLRPENKIAPNGTGEDLVGNQENITKDLLEGNVATTAIPALSGE